MPTISELQQEVKNYIDQALRINGQSDDIFTAATISLETLKEITKNPACTGIRIYLSKDDSGKSGGGVWPIIVPVSRSGEGSDAVYTDLIEDGVSPLSDGLVLMVDCRNPPCKTPNEGAKLLPS